MKYPVNHIVWKDHAEAGTGSWSSTLTLGDNKLATAVSIGFVVHEDDDTVQISPTYLEDHDFCGRPDIIAKALIVHRVELTVEDYIPPIRKKKRGL